MKKEQKIKDRLKTLEEEVEYLKQANNDNQDIIQKQGEMIKFIMAYTKTKNGLFEHSLQDLWDEGKKETVEPPVKEEKIEEIINLVLDSIPVDNEATSGRFNYSSIGVNNIEDYQKGFREGYKVHTEETKRSTKSWLRDKLKRL